MTQRSILELFNAPRIPFCWATIGGNQAIPMATATQPFTVDVVVAATRWRMCLGRLVTAITLAAIETMVR